MKRPSRHKVTLANSESGEVYAHICLTVDLDHMKPESAGCIESFAATMEIFGVSLAKTIGLDTSLIN